METKKSKNSMKWVEVVFDWTYLLIVFGSALLLYKTGNPGSLRWKFALMSFILGLGDSFHLIPRILSLTNPRSKDYTRALGLGKIITSISMTIFYVLLWKIGLAYYPLELPSQLSIVIYGLALLRIILCLFPQNQWLDKNPSLKWGILRNIPFTILGMIVMGLFLLGSINYGGALNHLWLAILISFICYLPVVLWVHKYPKLGMLMLPKSCAYVWIVLMGFSVF